MAPFAATNALARLLNGPAPWGEPEPPPPPQYEPPPPDDRPPPPPAPNDDVAQLRRELDELKKSLQKKRR
jgi:hypothetical protein